MADRDHRDYPLSPGLKKMFREAQAIEQDDKTREALRVLRGLARIKPKDDSPASLAKARDARIAYGLKYRDALNAAKKNPATKDYAKAVEKAAFDTGGGGILKRTASDLLNAPANTARYAGSYAKAIAGDAADTARGKPTAKRFLKASNRSGHGVADVVTDPLEHPGDFVLLALPVARPGTEGAAAVGRGAKGLKAGREAASTDPMRALRSQSIPVKYDPHANEYRYATPELERLFGKPGERYHPMADAEIRAEAAGESVGRFPGTKGAYRAMRGRKPVHTAREK
jgi:hypothetical protein